MIVRNFLMRYRNPIQIFVFWYLKRKILNFSYLKTIVEQVIWIGKGPKKRRRLLHESKIEVPPCCKNQNHRSTGQNPHSPYTYPFQDLEGLENMRGSWHRLRQASGNGLHFHHIPLVLGCHNSPHIPSMIRSYFALKIVKFYCIGN